MFSEDGVPTSVDFVRCDPGQMVATYTSANTYLFDLETSKQVLTIETKQNSGNQHSKYGVFDANSEKIFIFFKAHMF